MTKLSSAARAAEGGDGLDVDYSERSGFLTGRNAAIQDWKFRKEQQEGDFKRLIWRLQANKYWRSKDPERRARIVDYRKRWAAEHPERMREIYKKAHRKLRSDPEYRERENEAKRAKRAVESQARRAATVYTCAQCGSQWSPVGRIPARAPKYCDQRCLAKANYQRGKAAGKPWALRTKEHRRDRKAVSAV